MTFPQYTIELSDAECNTSQFGMAQVGLFVNRYTMLASRIVKAMLSTLPLGQMPLDLVVYTQGNSNTNTEGVSWTYRKFNDFPPIAA